MAGDAILIQDRFYLGAIIYFLRLTSEIIGSNSCNAKAQKKDYSIHCLGQNRFNYFPEYISQAEISSLERERKFFVVDT